MGKDQSLSIASPFKFGFYAGLGFFFASMLTSGITVVLVIALGIGTIGAIFSSAHKTPEAAAAPEPAAKPAGVTIAPTRTHRPAADRVVTSD